MIIIRVLMKNSLYHDALVKTEIAINKAKRERQKQY
jgi:hypothetical protein